MHDDRSSRASPQTRAVVCLRDLSGEEHLLGPGDIVGRLWTAALQVDDPRVSEAHAMVSLRGGSLWLLALRRRFLHAGQPLSELRLEVGQEVLLAADLPLEVVDVRLPSFVLGLDMPGMPRVILPAICSLHGRPEPRLSSRYEPGAPCRIWSDGRSWTLEQGEARRELVVGDRFEVEGVPILVVAMPLAGSAETHMTGGVEPSLRVIAAYDTVTIQRGDATASVVGGVIARILSELCAIGGPASWEVVAREVWPEDVDTATLRRRWDVAMSRTRARLRAMGVRHDLVSADHAGQVQLLLREGDVLEDLT